MRIGITGMSGSLGTALTERLVASGLGPVVGITRDEFKAEQIAKRYGGIGGQVRIMVVSEGIKDQAKLVEVFRGCEVLVHAAALKRISGSVYAAEEMVETNVNGTLAVLKAATAAGVSKVLVISSDKAVQATNLYGGTKFLAECLAVQENSFSYPRGTRISCCRYGNVLGSRGSVVPLWRELAAAGAPLHVTDKRMTRFVITMRQAVDFILACILCMRGGEIFIPQLPMAHVYDLAKAISNDVVVDNQLRPGGEKLAESLLSQEEPSRTVWRTLDGGFRGPQPALAVLPSHRTWSSEPYAGEPVESGMTYTSDQGPMLSVDDLKKLLEETP